MLKFAYESHVTMMPVVSVAGKYGTSLVVFNVDKFTFQLVLKDVTKNMETRYVHATAFSYRE